MSNGLRPKGKTRRKEARRNYKPNPRPQKGQESHAFEAKFKGHGKKQKKYYREKN